MEFTDAQRLANYAAIQRALDTIQSGHITPEWVLEQNQRILEYRAWIPDYTVVNADIDESGFRKCCRDAEVLLQHLCFSVRSVGHFDVRVYQIFLQNIKTVIDTTYDDDELADMMGMLSAK